MPVATTPSAASDSDLLPQPRPMGMEMGMPPGHSFDKDSETPLSSEAQDITDGF